MYKIYLDNCVFQDLKKDEDSRLLQKVLDAKSFVLFPFSEAHLFDLNQDKTDKKFDDMKFIESISDSNCYYFDDRTRFKYQTPFDNYSDFDWPDMSNYESILEKLSLLGLEALKAIPLSFADLVATDQFPHGMTEEMKRLLSEPSNFYDFSMSLIGFSEELTNDQKKFREHLKYLHANSLIESIYKTAGIECYDGEQVTDIEKFWSSYAKKFIAEGQQKTRYDLYIDMYNGLEIYGFVKGKPRKQKMMNLINDARHSFFGTVCDIIVSKDADFLEKTKFMYFIERTGTKIVTYEELDNTLSELYSQSQLQFDSLFKELAAPISNDSIFQINDQGKEREIFVRLSNTYYCYFNLLGYITDAFGTYRVLCKERKNYSRGTLVKQIKYVIDRLLDDLGPDLYRKGELKQGEKVQDKSELRIWSLGNTVVSLILDEKLYLNFYPLDYLQTRWNKDKEDHATTD